MGAQNTYTYGNSKAATGRPDLGFAVSRWLSEYGLGPNSKYVALRACGMMPVSGPGKISLLGKGFGFEANGDNPSSVRGIGAALPPFADPKDRPTYNVLPLDRGRAVGFDDNDPNVLDMRRTAGAANVEMVFAQASLNHCLESLDRKLLGTDTGGTGMLAASTSPFVATDVDASGARWDTASSSIRDDIHDAEINYDGTFDSVIYTQKVHTNFRANTDFTGMFGGLSGLGTLTQEQATGAWAAFGIKNVYVADTNTGLSDFVILYRKGSGNPLVDQCGVICAFIQNAGAGPEGVGFSSWDAQSGRVHYVWAYHTSDFVVEKDGGCRIKDVLA